MNASGTDDLKLPLRPMALVIFESTCAVLFTALAVVGNVLIFAAFIRERSLRTVPNVFLLNLSVADILSAFVSLPLMSSTLVTGRWTFGAHVCQLQAFQSYSSYACSLCTMTVISVSRYLVTVHPLRYHGGMFLRKTMVLIVTGTWLIAIAFAATPLLGWGVFHFESFYALCIHVHSASASYNSFLFVFLMINTSVIVVTYVRIFKVVKARKHGVRKLCQHASGVNQQRILSAQEEKVTNTLFVIICLFGICYLPTIIQGFLVFTTLEIPRFARMLSTFSVSLTCVTNPVVYWVRNATFRRTLRDLICKKKNQVEDSHNTVFQGPPVLSFRLNEIARRKNVRRDLRNINVKRVGDIHSASHKLFYNRNADTETSVHCTN